MVFFAVPITAMFTAATAIPPVIPRISASIITVRTNRRNPFSLFLPFPVTAALPVFIVISALCYLFVMRHTGFDVLRAGLFRVPE